MTRSTPSTPEALPVAAPTPASATPAAAAATGIAASPVTLVTTPAEAHATGADGRLALPGQQQTRMALAMISPAKAAVTPPAAQAVAAALAVSLPETPSTTMPPNLVAACAGAVAGTTPVPVAASRRLGDRKPRRRHGDRGEGVISAAIAVLIIAFLGAAMWVAFNTIWEGAETKINTQVNSIGSQSSSTSG